MNTPATLNHTQGPWEWRGGWLFNDDRKAMCSRTVLQVTEDKWRPTEADARLIAAAPDLLEACLSAEDKYQRGSLSMSAEELQRVTDLRRAALAKALHAVAQGQGK